MDGDAYARDIYEEGSKHYQHLLKHYGHPSKFGYKDIIALWKAEKWDPDRLMGLYKKAGRAVFREHGLPLRQLPSVELEVPSLERGEHGPAPRRGRRVAEGGQEIRAALRRLGAHGVQGGLDSDQPRADQKGPWAGVPYDCTDPRFADLYGLRPTGHERTLARQVPSMADRVVPAVHRADRQLPPRLVLHRRPRTLRQRGRAAA